jgi:hypothetical protein
LTVNEHAIILPATGSTAGGEEESINNLLSTPSTNSSPSSLPAAEKNNKDEGFLDSILSKVMEKREERRAQKVRNEQTVTEKLAEVMAANEEKRLKLEESKLDLEAQRLKIDAQKVENERRLMDYLLNQAAKINN